MSFCRPSSPSQSTRGNLLSGSPLSPSIATVTQTLPHQNHAGSPRGDHCPLRLETRSFSRVHFPAATDTCLVFARSCEPAVNSSPRSSPRSASLPLDASVSTRQPLGKTTRVVSCSNLDTPTAVMPHAWGWEPECGSSRPIVAWIHDPHTTTKTPPPGHLRALLPAMAAKSPRQPKWCQLVRPVMFRRRIPTAQIASSISAGIDFTCQSADARSQFRNWSSEAALAKGRLGSSPVERLKPAIRRPSPDVDQPLQDCRQLSSWDRLGDDLIFAFGRQPCGSDTVETYVVAQPDLKAWEALNLWP